MSTPCYGTNCWGCIRKNFQFLHWNFYTGPDVLLFKRFRDHWKFIESDKVQVASSDPLVESLVALRRSDISEFARRHLATAQPRDDYREFLELSVVFLRGVSSRGIWFRIPGAMHRARWMAKVIYTI
jgi:hypothetical protein